jgi:benzoyl-CoA reductase/2-hydroxyglutaryl-CoA dehydratase subunit BcrC/BadD/HgdB
MGETVKADAHLHPNLCAYVRACLGSALNNDYSDLAGIIGIDSCDAMRRLYEVWCSTFSPGFSRLLALPHFSTPEAAKLYASELEGLVEALNQHFSLKISDADLRSGIDTMNETRSLLQDLDRLRNVSSSISGKQFSAIVRDAMICPKDEFNPWLRDLLRDATNEEQNSSGNTRVVLAGGMLDDPWLLEVIEEAGGRVVADDMCFGSRYYQGLTGTNEEPLLAIANRYMFRAPCARMFTTEARVRRLVKLVEESKARGLIYYIIKFCDPHSLEWVTINRQLQTHGIPTLQCETDYSVGGRERMKIRIEAFMEMIR